MLQLPRGYTYFCQFNRELPRIARRAVPGVPWHVAVRQINIGRSRVFLSETCTPFNPASVRQFPEFSATFSGPPSVLLRKLNCFYVHNDQ